MGAAQERQSNRTVPLATRTLETKEVAARLGHKDTTTTLRTYSHLWPTDDDRTRQAIEDAFSGAFPALAL